MTVASPAFSADPSAGTQRPAGRRSLAIVLSLVAVTSLTLGLVAYGRYRQAETSIRAAIADFRARGESLSATGCVDQALLWHRSCDAMLSLCDASVSRLVNACLQGRERRASCRDLVRDRSLDARAVYARCKTLGATARRGKKACVDAHRMVAAYCRRAEQVRSGPEEAR